MGEFLFQGHGSYRIITKDGTVIYVDPYAGSGYDLPADLILVTHQHGDHNQVGLVTKNKDCVLITEKEALKGKEYQSFTVKGVKIEAVPAYNKNHDPSQCVGYILKIDDISFYASGDTSTTEFIKQDSPKYHLDYAVLPIDGIYNMDAVEASKCGDMLGAKHVIPIHMVPGKLFDRVQAEKFQAKNRLIVEAGETIQLN